VRITGGEFRGRQIKLPPSRVVRPLSGKVCQALFNVVGSPAGWAVLDVYAGTGAVGFEAASRGAAMVEAIEANRTVARTIEENARSLGLDWSYVLNVMTAETWLAQPNNQLSPEQLQRYDLIVADPPYSKLDPEVLERLGRFLKPYGVMAVSHSSKRPSPVLESLVLAQAKQYGDSALSFYRRDT